MDTLLKKFLKDAKNMHAREVILLHRFLYDIKLEAARNSYYLNSYFDDIDHDGFDVIFDDQDYIKKIQLKSVVGKSTKSWSIHKKLLRPSRYLLSILGFECSPIGEGTEGGVILIEFQEKNEDLEIFYYYTDVFVLLAFECKIIRRKHNKSQKAVIDCLAKLRQGLGSEMMSVPKAAFIKSKNIDSLMSLMGLHNNAQSSWKDSVIKIANNILPPPADRLLALDVPIDKMYQFAIEEILKLTSDMSIVPCPCSSSTTHRH
ncbi:MAG: hypothetical protein KGN35_06460 [Betaproteobacteria bacterium]|nr:hypothetical protein [Betaproteobacteria bacterium]